MTDAPPKTTSAVLLDAVTSLDAKVSAELRTIKEDLKFGSSVKDIASQLKLTTASVAKIAQQPINKADEAQLKAIFGAAVIAALKPLIDEHTRNSHAVMASYETRHGSAATQRRQIVTGAMSAAAGFAACVALAKYSSLGVWLVPPIAPVAVVAPVDTPAPAVVKLVPAEQWAAGLRQAAEANPEAFKDIQWRSTFLASDLTEIERCRQYSGVFSSTVKCTFDMEVIKPPPPAAKKTR